MIKDKLVDEYKKYVENVLATTWRTDDPQIVVRMKPSTYFEMVAECHKESTVIPEFYTSEFRDIMYTRLCGVKTPIILDYTLPEEVTFTIQSREDYQRLEIKELHSKFFKMFDE